MADETQPTTIPEELQPSNPLDVQVNIFEDESEEILSVIEQGLNSPQFEQHLKDKGIGLGNRGKTMVMEIWRATTKKWEEGRSEIREEPGLKQRLALVELAAPVGRQREEGTVEYLEQPVSRLLNVAYAVVFINSPEAEGAMAGAFIERGGIIKPVRRIPTGYVDVSISDVNLFGTLGIAPSFEVKPGIEKKQGEKILEYLGSGVGIFYKEHNLNYSQGDVPLA
ncbi:hypothetical protein A2962_04630 [Candidatus Woesebacteria bacterium RIFCSPLOWO2_01_FULL_39_61]|uniref:Uncharacterized protein n=1 Tax=Candidatus Woesebacteria bacterium RIFCSPHIGHO2_02_FULL_39_13 TaxID=1802505 RepID=A0A1F7Z465_9BACT|nr:MAG: hypothetical protein A2692_03445 [Candidatus Woesebacteria bacterium RIFCSPHIGHO2_01_FULL_39_95]OGM33889.1 MAG: hypothetical protein A3D01_01735 [Candidatus Woesebacteria bacterium RIFCSPHIGHO2_02_FULL_39_13]OGM38896.1 MAG: hypothetical protein A3E13_04030 [Candidatus Woesebacteria bacterium RIFCSPHIGHO2_12_FULL_40_20]OGM67835.1 MAG: hypothetical protein A2962_04630 [Candidatus Woesebacteria bacterium RIFCSPLOWO2_01_FULL_39_61]OGM75387.1 MAG: hypothetical protein A3H19_01650 [Candidatus